MWPSEEPRSPGAGAIKRRTGKRKAGRAFSSHCKQLELLIFPSDDHFKVQVLCSWITTTSSRMHPQVLKAETCIQEDVRTNNLDNCNKKQKALESSASPFLENHWKMPHYMLPMQLLWLKNLVDDAIEACEKAYRLAENLEKNI